jgi:hypothetical protein
LRSAPFVLTLLGESTLPPSCLQKWQLAKEKTGGGPPEPPHRSIVNLLDALDYYHSGKLARAAPRISVGDGAASIRLGASSKGDGAGAAASPITGSGSGGAGADAATASKKQAANAIERRLAGLPPAGAEASTRAKPSGRVNKIAQVASHSAAILSTMDKFGDR